MTDVSLDVALAEFRSIFKELAAEASARDLSHEHPYDEVQRLANAGFGRLRVPQELGGFGVGLRELFDLLVEAGQADSNIPQILRGHFTTVEILRLSLPNETAEYWLRKIADGAVFGNGQSEPAGTGQGFVVSTRVDELDGIPVVNGTKFYSTGSRFADYIRVAVGNDDGRRSFVVVPARHAGVTHVDDWDGIGQRLTGSGTTHFDNVPIDGHSDVGQSRESLRSLPIFTQLVHLANLAGVARNLVDDVRALVLSRKRTSLHALSDVASSDPEVLGVVGDIYIRSLAIDTLLHTAVDSLGAAEAANTAEAYEESYIATSAAQVAIIDDVLEAATIAFNAGGSSAVHENAHLDRHWRNARTLASHNPVIYKPRVIGDYVVNGTSPRWSYERALLLNTSDRSAEVPRESSGNR